MTDIEVEFQSLMERVRAGCQDAARELFEKYGEHVLRVVRRNLAGQMQVRRQYDSTDVTQSVWASFFHTPPERFDFPTPEALVGFLMQVASHKVTERLRATHTLKRDVTREVSLEAPESGKPIPLVETLPGNVPTPSQVAIAGERWEEMTQGLPPHLRRILELLRDGHTYGEIAEATGVSAKMIQRLMQPLRRRFDLP